MAGLATNGHFDLHAATLATVDTESALLRATRTVGKNDDVRNNLRLGRREHLTRKIHRTGAIVIFFAGRAVGAHDHALERALGFKFELDLGRDGCANNATQLVSRTTTENQSIPFGIGRNPAQFLFKKLFVYLCRINDAVEAIDANSFLKPALAQRAHSVGMTIDVNNLFFRRRDAVLGIFHRPDEIAKIIHEDIFRVAHCLNLDNLLTQVFQTRKLVVGRPAVWIATLLNTLVDVISGNPDSFFQHLRGKGKIFGGQFCNTSI